ncbi:Hypothetical_protein [Hexamita inflata]|uniref:Hypothetical_protein n=1 Tax=Hexamita inflata TaxID=28002 RepID=A0AA86UE31_9EUKA|nr:Hypothetical protein HINF_LOCUS39719 [Hexamita inflata]CAI9952080.1 Hypothetical protein HINF_LOCUS39725 [Hexamita inflata]
MCEQYKYNLKVKLNTYVTSLKISYLLKRKLRKRKRINNLSQKSLSNHSQKLVKMNQKRQLTQNRKPSQAQQKPRKRSSKWNIRNSLSKNRELRKISTRLNPRKQLIYPRQYTPKLGICKNKQTKTEPRNLIKLMKRCIKGNHHQTMPIQRNNLPCKPEGNNEQRETEKRQPVSGNQVSESDKTGPLTTQ